MASDKNLYRSIRLGRIVNSNGRVIGSIVKTEKEREYRDGEMRDVMREGANSVQNEK